MLNAFKQKRPYSNKAVLVLIVLYLFTALCCGKRKPPLPPVERVPQKVEISGTQRGNIVLLNWTMPSRNASDGSILKIDRVDIYRYAEPSTLSLSLTQEDFAARSTLINSIKFTDNDFGLKKQTYTDKLEFAEQPIRLIYAVRFVNAEGQKADFSNFLLVEPSAKVAKNLENIVAEVTEPAIIIKWNPPTSNVDDSTPVNILGYNIYRKEDKAEEFKLLNPSVESGASYSDESFEFGKKYQYIVRTVSLGTDGEKVESLDSNIIEISPKDTFAPSAPDAITIAAVPNNLSIFFAANPEKDIAGYRIYRSVDQNFPLSEWTLLTPEILKTNTFQDKQIERGKTYFYYLTAIDIAGNISQPSEIVSETAP
jgi:hypothetical protein